MSTGLSVNNALGRRPIGNITSLDTIIYAKCDQIAPAPFRIFELADGTAVPGTSKERAVTKSGVNGVFVHGIVARPSVLTITCFPNSPFLTLVDEWCALALKRAVGLEWAIDITQPAIGKHVSYSQGVITNTPDLPGIGDTLENVPVEFTFGHYDVTSIGFDTMYDGIGAPAGVAVGIGPLTAGAGINL